MTSTPSPSPSSPIETGELEKHIRDLARDLGVVGGQVAISDHEQVLQVPVGFGRLGPARQTSQDRIFQIGSVTKVYTAVLMMILKDRGELDLETPVREYLPAFALGDEKAAATVTPRHLMSMTSGITNGPYCDNGPRDDAVARAVARLADLMARLGEAYGYSNASTIVSGLIIERLTKTTWDRALREMLLEPVGLEFSASDAADQIYHDVALGYSPHGTDVVRPWIYDRGQGPSGSTLATSAGDLVRFAQIFLNRGVAANGRRIRSDAAVDEMQQRQVDVPNPSVAAGWCLGPREQTWGARVLGHTGSNIAGVSTLYWMPDTNRSVAVVVNTPERGSLFVEAVMDWVLPQIGVDKPRRVVPQPGPVRNASDDVGVYQRAGVTITVTADDDHLAGAKRRDVDGDANIQSGPTRRSTTCRVAVTGSRTSATALRRALFGTWCSNGTSLDESSNCSMGYTSPRASAEHHPCLEHTEGRIDLDLSPVPPRLTASSEQAPPRIPQSGRPGHCCRHR